jgi:hypothetical protein
MLNVGDALFEVKAGTLSFVRHGALAQICATFVPCRKTLMPNAGQSPLCWKNSVNRLVPSANGEFKGANAQVGPFIKEPVNPSGVPFGSPAVRKILYMSLTDPLVSQTKSPAGWPAESALKTMTPVRFAASEWITNPSVDTVTAVRKSQKGRRILCIK